MTRFPLRLVAAAAVLCVMSAACSSGSDDAVTNGPGESPTTAAPSISPESGEIASEFPVTVDHEFGTTVIESEPQRVVALGFGEGDLVAALGMTPVAVNSYGTAGGSITPWLKAATDGSDIELLDTMAGIPFEDVAALTPDLILASTLPVSAGDYDLLSAIAPTVVTGALGITTTWQEATIQGARDLGRSGDADALVADAEAQITAAATAHPEFEGLTVAVGLVMDQATINVIVDPDQPTLQLLAELGFELAPSIAALEPNASASTASLSAENVSALDADVVLVTGASGANVEGFLEQSVVQALEVSKNGQLIVLPLDLWSAMRVPTVLSLPYAATNLATVISDALAQ